MTLTEFLTHINQKPTALRDLATQLIEVEDWLRSQQREDMAKVTRSAFSIVDELADNAMWDEERR